MAAPTVRCDHLHLRSLDVEAAARFYVEMFGGAVAGRRELPTGPRLTVELGGLRLFIDQVSPETVRPPQPPFLGLEHLALAVDDLDELAAALRSRGVPFAVEPRELRPGVRYGFINGPDDVLLELLERRDVPPAQ